MSRAEAPRERDSRCLTSGLRRPAAGPASSSPSFLSGFAARVCLLVAGLVLLLGAGAAHAQDTTPPTFSSAEALAIGSPVQQVQVQVHFNENLDTNSRPPISTFTVTVNGTASTISTVVISNELVDGSGTVVLTLPGNSVTHGDTVKVRYTKPSSSPLVQDTAGNPVATFSDQTVTNKVPDTTPPTFSSAAVNGKTLSITFNEDLDTTSAPAGSAFTVSGGRTGTGTASLSGKTATVTLDSAVPPGATTLTASYTMPSSNPLQDAAGNPVATFTGQTVTNDSTAPTFSSAAVNGETLTVTFSENLDTTSAPAGSAFTVSGGRTGTGTASLSGKTATVTLNSAVPPGATALTVSYTKPSSNPLQDAVGNPVATFTGQTVTNNTPDTTPPTFSSAKVNGTTLTVTFNEGLDAGSSAATGDFFVTVGTSRRNATGIAITGATVTLTLASAVTSTDTVKVRYTQPASNLLRDAAGNPVASFTDKTVTNNTPDTTPPVFASTSVNGMALTITFNENLDATSKPAPGDFAVTVDGNSRNVTSVAISGAAVRLKLAPAVTEGQTVMVSYTQPASNPLRDAAGNKVPSFTNLNVANITRPPLPPGYSIQCSDWGYWYVAGDGISGNPGARSGIACDMAKPGWIFEWNRPGYIQWVYRGDRVVTPYMTSSGQIRTSYETIQGGPARPPVNQPVANGTHFAAFTYIADASNRAVRGADGMYYRERRVSGRWQRSISYGSDMEARRKASWNAHYRWRNRSLVNPDGGTFPSGPPPAVTPVFESAKVGGKTLTMTFDANLDTGSVPSPGAFRVTVNNARRNVAAGGVAIAGKTVSLTLASAVSETDTVKVRYSRPSARPLRGAAYGRPVAGFADRAVTNNTGRESVETPGNPVGLVSNTGVGHSKAFFGAVSAGGSRAQSFTTGSYPDGYRLTHVDVAIRLQNAGDAPSYSVSIRQGSSVNPGTSLGKLTNPTNVPTAFEYSRFTASGGGIDLAANTTYFVTLKVDAGSVDYAVTGSSAEDPASISGWSIGNTLRAWDPGGSWRTFSSPFLIAINGYSKGSSANSGPGVQAASVTGNKLKVTYDEPLDEGSAPPGGSFRVTTTPEGGANGNRPRAASVNGPVNIGGTGTASVDGTTVTITLDRPVAPGQRVMVSYTPPGTNPVRDVEGDEAAAFSGRPAANVAPAPAVTGVAVVSDSGSDNTYALGETLRVRLTFGEAVAVDASGGTPRVKIKMDPRWGEFWADYASGGGTNALTFAYTVKKPNTAPSGIAVLANTLQLNGGTIKSASTRTNANLAHAGLGHDAAHKVDWRRSPPSANPAPAVTGVAVVSDAGEDNTYALGETLRVRLTFGETVNVGGTPRVKIKMDPRWGEFWASYRSGSGTNALTFAYTVAEPNTAPSGIAVLANTLQLNGGTIASAATSTNASLSHAGLGHNSAHKVDWRLSPPGAVGTGDTRAPLPESATVNARAVTLTFDEALVPVGTDAYLHFTLTVKGGGVEQSPVRASASGKTVTMQLGGGSPARAGQSYTIGYFGGGMLKDAAGNEVARFSGLAAENLTLPVLAVEDARGNEGADAALEFAVTLDAAVDEAVTVDYATADGSATAGEDYTATSGTLTFAAGERRKTVSVAILDDAIDEGEETFRLRLSNASGARIGDGEATGTIENDDPMPKAWTARFGRTVAVHVVDALETRLEGATESWVQLGGHRLGGGPDVNDTVQHLSPERSLWEEAGTADPAGREVAFKDLLLQSAFHLVSDPEDEVMGPRLSAWGRVATSGFDGREDKLSLDGSVTTATLGVDGIWKRWLTGLLLAYSEGDGSFSHQDLPGGDLTSSLTSVHPYAAYTLNDRVRLWGLVGYGSGALQLRLEDQRAMNTDLTLSMGALGVRGTLLEPAQQGGLQLALRSDVLWMVMDSAAADDLAPTEAEASRLRLVLEGSRPVSLAGGGSFTPSLEIGLRQDGGDAETGSGLEVGGSLRYASSWGLSIEASVRGLLAHEATDYREWGASGALRFDPGRQGKGLTASIVPSWGTASSAMSRLWEQSTAAGLAPDSPLATAAAEGRLQAELGYGLVTLKGRALLTPYARVALVQSADQAWHLGTRLTLEETLNLSLEASRRQRQGDAVAHQLALLLNLGF